MPEPSHLINQVTTVQLTDTEIRQVMRNASQEATRVINSLGDDLSRSQKLRAMQLNLAKVNADMWGTVGDATKVGIGDAFDATAEWMAQYDQSLMKAVGAGQTYWRQSMLAASREGLPNYIARKENGITLSDRVYRNQALSRGYLDKTINNALVLGKSPRELAADVRKYIHPDVPGGASYAAMRLGRTEVVNAYHTSAVNRYKESPWVERVKWNLSGRHSRPDDCNEYAEGQHHVGKGWNAGEYRPTEVPGKPHPQCLCYVTPVVPDLDTFAKNFKNGRYDDHIQNVMGCSRVA